MSINIFSISVDLFSFVLLCLLGFCSLIIIKKRYFKKKKPYIHDTIDTEKLEAAEKALNDNLEETKNSDYCIIVRGSTLEGHDFNWANKIIGILASRGIKATYKSFDTAEYISQFHILVPVEERHNAIVVCTENGIKVYK